VFAEHLAGYVQVRRRLGLRFDTQQAMLRGFDRYVSEVNYSGPLTQELVWRFATSVGDPTSQLAARRYLVIRHFSEYLAAYDPDTPRLDPKAIAHRHHQPLPYIFADSEIQQLMAATQRLSQRPAIANAALRTMIGLAASAGLRLREVTALDEADVDWSRAILFIRHTKFDKDRCVPVHLSTLDALRSYAALRSQVPHLPTEKAFFLNARRHRYQSGDVDRLFGKLVRQIDLRSPHRKLPTFGSLRHTFAVRRLISWHCEKANVQALLPALATYMGHVHYTSTAYYLTATAELLAIAAQRLGQPEVSHG